MTRVIEAAARGEALFGAGIAERLMGFFAVGGSHVKAFPELTDREREILALIGQGLNNASIARRLTIAEKTVRNHINNIFSKLHIADRADAIIRAREQGLE
jgi:DNA-binding NarL/FixJ family response regulator